MPKTILLADDSVTIQKVIELTFMDEDYEVVSVGNGDEALDRLEEVTPDVVIADVHMPGASGYDVARRARQLHPEAPVLLLVGTFEPFDEGDYQASGAAGYLKKPFDSQELLTRVSKLMADRPAAGQAGPGAAPAAPPAPEAPPAAAAAAPSFGAGAGQPWEEEASVPAASTEELPPPGEPPSPGSAAGAWATETLTPPDEADETMDRTDWAGEAPPWDDEKTDPFRVAQETPPAHEPQPIAAEAQREADVPDATATRAIPAAGREPEAELGGWQGSAWDLEAAESAGAEEQAEPGEASPWTGGWELEEEPAPTQVQPPETAAEEPGAAQAAAPPIGMPGTETPESETPAAGAPETGRPTWGEPEPFPELSAPPAAPAAPAAQEPSVSGVAAAARAAASAPAAGGEARLSDEDVDRIARRVAELIGDPVLREVAWEVVPDLAEVVIKDRLRELEAQVD